MLAQLLEFQNTLSMKKRTYTKPTLLLLFVGIFALGAFTGPKLMEALTANDIKAALKVSGLNFTKPEIDSLLPGVQTYQEQYEANRAVSIPNSVAPATQFNPLPLDFIAPKRSSSFASPNPGKIKVPEDKEELAFMSVFQLAYLLRTKQISSVELTRFFIDRIKKYDPTLKCVVTITEELAMEQAKRADEEIAAGKYKGSATRNSLWSQRLISNKKIQNDLGSNAFQGSGY